MAATKTAVLFNPQVVVQPGDYRDLYERFPAIQQRFAEASDVLGLDLAGRFYSEDPAQINRGPVVRPSSLALAVGLFDAAGLDDSRPDYMAGLSLGSIVAAHVGGFMSFRDAVRMTHTMPLVEDEIAAGLGLGVAFYYNVDIGELTTAMTKLSSAESPLLPCAITADNQMIVTGHATALEKLNARAAVLGGVGIVIPYGPPAHSPLPALRQIRQRFAERWRYLDGTADPQVPQICNLSGAVLSTRAAIEQVFIDQYTTTVRWDLVLWRLADLGVTAVTVVGPGHFVRKSLMFTEVQFDVQTVLGLVDLLRQPSR